MRRSREFHILEDFVNPCATGRKMRFWLCLALVVNCVLLTCAWINAHGNTINNMMDNNTHYPIALLG